MLSLDHDARDFALTGRRDPVMRRLQLAAPGLRPPLFHSPYEAAAWSVLSARRPQRQMARVRTALCESAGRRFTLAGQRLAAFPTPVRPAQARRVSRASTPSASTGCTVSRVPPPTARSTPIGLAALGPDEAMAAVQRIKGIGPVYASLIVIRAIGFTDVAPFDEPRAQRLVGELYGLGAPATPDQFSQIAEAWRPWRTWASVYVRAVGPRVLAAPARLSA